MSAQGLIYTQKRLLFILLLNYCFLILCSARFFIGSANTLNFTEPVLDILGNVLLGTQTCHIYTMVLTAFKYVNVFIYTRKLYENGMGSVRYIFFYTYYLMLTIYMSPSVVCLINALYSCDAFSQPRGKALCFSIVLFYLRNILQMFYHHDG